VLHYLQGVFTAVQAGGGHEDLRVRPFSFFALNSIVLHAIIIIKENNFAYGY
jgi:hypothetical protein